MKTIETAINIQGADLRSIELEVGSIVCGNGEREIVLETHYEEGRLVRFTSVRRDDGYILESGYCVNEETGKTEQLFSGIHFGNENPPFHASGRYSELNKFLEEREK